MDEAKAADSSEETSRRKPRPKRHGLEPTDTMAEAGRRILAFHFLRMLDHEPGVRLGEDPEEVHDMRVATRRMRAALRVFSAHLDPAVMKPHRKGLRRTARLLGAVRDLDVFHEKTLRYRDGLPADRRDELDPLLAAWLAAREMARVKLIAYLDGDEYRGFRQRLEELIATPGAGAVPWVGSDGEPLPHEIRHVVPPELYRRYAAVRAFDAPLAEPEVPLARYHQLRIATKRLRYTIEFFEEILGGEAKSLIRDAKALQDHLGNLQDAVVASELSSYFLRKGRWKGEKKCGRVVPAGRGSPGVAAYQAAREAEMQALLGRFPAVWERVNGREFASRLGALATEISTGERGASRTRLEAVDERFVE